MSATDGEPRAATAASAAAARLLERLLSRLASPTAGGAIVLAAVLLMLPSLCWGLGADDHYFRMVWFGCRGLPELARPTVGIFDFADGDPVRNLAGIERGLYPWWSAPELRLAFWRPLAALTHALDFRAWPESAVAMHAHSLLWYAALAWVVTRLYRRFLAPAALAALAALLYVIDDAHVIAVSWIAARNSVLSCLAAALVLVCHDRWRREGRTSGAWLGPLALAVGLACGEGAIGVGGYLAAYALCLDRGSWRSRCLALVPYTAPVAAWLVARHAVAAGATGSGLYVDPLGSPLRFTKQVVVQLPVLLLDQFASVNPVAWMVLGAVERGVWVVGAALVLWVVVRSIAPILRRDATLRFWALGALLATVPACAVFPQSRVLFLTGLGGAAVIARSLEVWLRRPAWIFDGRRWATPLGLLAPLSLVAHLVLAPILGVLASPWMAIINHEMGRVALDLPAAATRPGAEVTIVTLPTDILLHAIPYIRASLDRPAVPRLRALHAGLGALTLQRADVRTLVLEARSTFIEWPSASMFRDPATDPFRVGEIVDLADARIEIRAVDGKGRPRAIAFSARTALDDRSRIWLTWSEGRLVPFELPAVGETVAIAEIDLPQLVWESIVDFVASGAWLRAHAVDPSR